MEVVTLFVNFYKSLDTQSLSELKNIYSDDVVFVDPVTRHKGFAAVHRYFEQLLVDVNECTFDISQIKEVDSTVFVNWTMHFRHPKLKAGKLISVEGVSQLIVKEHKICYQRDYYDLGSMLYEHVPLIGSVIKFIKKRLAS
ncbi:MAG: transcriptional regulator [Alteromonadaceae bacterium]|nr:transcriptional regulator [Alteromonadaceae bacterium]MBB17954.1 transcriptional regulator [Rickettsiales bacterium]